MINDTQITAIANVFHTWERAEQCYIRMFRISDCGVYTEAYTRSGTEISRVMTMFADDVIEVIKKIYGSLTIFEVTILHYQDPECYSVWVKDLFGSEYRQFKLGGA